MRLIPITRQFDEGTIWINPKHVLAVVETNIGHKNQGVIGTGITVQELKYIKTNEQIESVLERLRGGE